MTDIPIRPSIRRRHEAIGGRLISRLTIALSLLIGIALFFLYQRFVYGLGAVTNINNGYPWGIWVVWDVIIATGFACGGYAMALLVYILNRGEFHPMIRSALTASVFGYSLGGLSVLIDLGRYWNFWHILSPSYFNPGSVMFEVAACITLYIVVLWIEWFPTFLEWLGTRGIQKAFERMLFFFIGLGVLLPSMHQSSLGSLLIAMGYQVHPLWQTPFLPLLFLMTALCMGYAVVIFEATLAAVGFARDVREELPLLAKLGKVVASVLLMFMVLRFADIIDRGQIAQADRGEPANHDVLDRDGPVRLPDSGILFRLGTQPDVAGCSRRRRACWRVPCSTASTLSSWLTTAPRTGTTSRQRLKSW